MKEISFDDFADLLCSGDDCIKSKEWACTEGVDGYANQYEIETDNLRILNLSADEYTILHWLALLMTYRKLRLSTPVMKRGAEWLKEHFLVDIDDYDYCPNCGQCIDWSEEE